MPRLEVVSEYTPSGDQPEAIDALSQGIEMGRTKGINAVRKFQNQP